MFGRDTRIWVVVAGWLAAIVACNSVLAVTLTQSVTNTLMLREGQVAQQFLTSILAAEKSSDRLFDTPAPSAALTSFATHVRSLPGTVRANIYSPDTFIRYSTDPSLVGLQFKDNAELAESFAGAIKAKLETVSESDKDEHIALNRLPGEQIIEAYIPVTAPNGQVATVVEFYRDAGDITAAVRSVQRTIWTAAAISGVILFLTVAAVLMLGRRLRG